MKKKYLEAGKIVNTHGVRGELKIQPWADSADFLRGFKVLYIDEKPIRVTGSFVHKGYLIAKLEGIDDANAAMAYKNRVVYIDRDDAKLGEGEFFIQDIIGADVRLEDGQSVGSLAEVIDLPQGKVYVVRGEREILIPAVDEFILHTDADGGVVTVRLIEGM